MGQLESPISIEGEEAYQDNKPKSANPYNEGSDEHKEWNEGWDIEALFHRK